MKYNKLTVSLFFAGMLLLSGCETSDEIKDAIGEETPPPAQTQPLSETPPPAQTTPSSPVLESTTVTTVSGEVIRVDRTAGGFIFAGYEGKIVLLEMYGWNCPHCIEMIPGYNRLQNKYPNDVYVIALESYGTIDNAGLQQYAVSRGLQYDTVSKQNAGNMHSYVQSLTGFTVEQGVPALLVLGRNGDLAEYFPPQILPEAYVDSLIQGLL